MNNRIYLLTGAAGFLGNTICNQLVMRGETVRAFVLPNDPYAKYLPEHVDVCEGDLSKRETMDAFFTVPDNVDVYVIHCGSIVTVNPAFSQKVYDVNVLGTKNVLYYCERLKGRLKSLVYVGSAGAMGSKPKGHTYVEPNFFSPELLPDCYGQTKAEASNLVIEAARHGGMNACVVMPTGIFGPEDHSHSVNTTLVVEIANGTMTTGIDGAINLVDVRDLANGIIAATELGKKGASYILGNESCTLRKFAQLVSETAGTKPMKRFIPCGVARVMAKVSEWYCRRSGKKSLLTTYTVDTLAQSTDYCSDKARRELGFTCRPYTETIRDTVNYLRYAGLIGK